MEYNKVDSLYYGKNIIKMKIIEIKGVTISKKQSEIENVIQPRVNTKEWAFSNQSTK